MEIETPIGVSFDCLSTFLLLSTMHTPPPSWLIESVQHQKKSQRFGLILGGLLVTTAILVQIFA
jgi:hypothetical protein